MKVSNLTRMVLARKRKMRDLVKNGYKRHEVIYHSALPEAGTRIVDVVIDPDGYHVWYRTEPR